MPINEQKHCTQLAERRLALFGDKPARVTLDDVFDVEAPDVGDVRWNMSPLEAYRVALYAEQKAFGCCEEALAYVTQPDVRALFEELRDEEAEHVQMLVKIIAKLPPSAETELEDEDYDPNRPAKDSFEVQARALTSASRDRPAPARRTHPARRGSPAPRRPDSDTCRSLRRRPGPAGLCRESAPCSTRRS